MAVQTAIKKQNITLKDLAADLRYIKSQLEKMTFLVPEESLKEYKNSQKIKKDYLRALKEFSRK